MASKTNKKTLRSQYTEILNDKDINILRCNILSYKFNSIEDNHIFHFNLMSNHIPYLLFDGSTEIANIIIPKDNIELEEKIKNIVKESSGVETRLKID